MEVPKRFHRTVARMAQVKKLRYLQNLTKIPSEKDWIILFPLPMDLLEVFLSDRGKKAP